MDVRPVETPAEMRGAIEINRAAWRAAYADFLPESTLSDPDAPLSRETVEARLDSLESQEETALLVACDGEDRAVCGFAEFGWGENVAAFVPDDAAELRALYVDPDRWRTGIGSNLVTSATDYLPSRVTSVATETFAENSGGREFLDARGFDHVDDDTCDVDGESYPTVVYTGLL